MITKSTIQSVNFKVDSDVKEVADSVLSGMGLNMSAYIGMCLRQVAQKGGMPFDMSVDSRFWEVESEISTAKRIVDAGLFEDIVGLRNDLCNLYEETMTEMLVALEKEEKDSTDLYNFAGVLNPVAVSINDSLESIKNGKSICPALGSMGEKAQDFFEKLTKDIEDKIDQFSISSSEGKSIAEDFGYNSNADATVCAACLDRIYFSVINVIKDHGDRVAMRYMGASWKLDYQDLKKCYEDYITAIEKNKKHKEQQQQSLQEMKDFAVSFAGARQ